MKPLNPIEKRKLPKNFLFLDLLIYLSSREMQASLAFRDFTHEQQTSFLEIYFCKPSNYDGKYILFLQHIIYIAIKIVYSSQFAFCI